MSLINYFIIFIIIIIIYKYDCILFILHI